MSARNIKITRYYPAKIIHPMPAGECVFCLDYGDDLLKIQGKCKAITVCKRCLSEINNIYMTGKGDFINEEDGSI